MSSLTPENLRSLANEIREYAHAMTDGTELKNVALELAGAVEAAAIVTERGSVLTQAGTA